ncbi:hypothetical protein [Streptomyces sp. NRRL S-813]|uniref:hypothetical protein n=1 Tax=Streptomyces sp. NRRL S-813 TaxID=1463919 RepID=UPI00131DD5FC|nr:hypothetical protein [Streptomyces sp. NRRL S-813]
MRCSLSPSGCGFATVDGSEDHTPDFLVLLPGTAVLVDVRPGHLIRDEDVVKFAAAQRAAAAVGWRYMVVTGWRRHVAGGLDALSARRRPMADCLGLHTESSAHRPATCPSSAHSDNA